MVDRCSIVITKFLMLTRVLLCALQFPTRYECAFKARVIFSSKCGSSSIARMSSPGAEWDDDNNNSLLPWSLEDDKQLLEGVRTGISIEDLCLSLKRGYQGVRLRIKAINNPKHRAYIRLYSGEDWSAEKEKASGSLRPCGEVIQRILWDPLLDVNDFSFVYADRFNGLCEKPAGAPNVDVKGKNRMLIKAIPEHRVELIKYKERVVWSKKDRIDLVFGTGTVIQGSGSSMHMQPALEDRSVTASTDSAVDETVVVPSSQERIRETSISDSWKDDDVRAISGGKVTSSDDTSTKQSDIDIDTDAYTDTGTEITEITDNDGYSSSSVTSSSFSHGDGFDLSWWDDDDDDDEENEDNGGFTSGSNIDSDNDRGQKQRQRAWLSASAGRVGSGMTIEGVIATYDLWLVEHREQQRKDSERNQVIFCDLDGVLADFDAGVFRLFKKKPSEVSPKVMWPRIATTVGFFEGLPWTQDGELLWKAIRKLNPTILTGVPRGAWAEPQKRSWCCRELGEGVQVITCMSKDKYKYCPPPPPPGGSESCDDSAISGANKEDDDHVVTTTAVSGGAGKTTATATVSAKEKGSSTTRKRPAASSISNNSSDINDAASSRSSSPAAKKKKKESKSSYEQQATSTSSITSSTGTADAGSNNGNGNSNAIHSNRRSAGTSSAAASRSKTASSSDSISITGISKGTGSPSEPLGGSGAILIDDKKDAGEPWEAAGGRFVHHTDTATTIRKLKELGINIDIDGGDIDTELMT